VALRLVYLIFIWLLSAPALIIRSDVSKDADVLVLRHRLAVLRRSPDPSRRGPVVQREIPCRHRTEPPRSPTGTRPQVLIGRRRSPWT
jgi:hypothetical protein